MFTFRRAILQATRYSGSWNRAPSMISQRLPLISYSYNPRANFSAASGLSRDEIRTRILNVIEGFEKVDAGKLQETSSFAKDLGLDSLDAVEVVMAIEEDFGIEIPDEDADAIQTVQQAIDYISKTPEAHERDDRVESMEKRE